METSDCQKCGFFHYSREFLLVANLFFYVPTWLSGLMLIVSITNQKNNNDTLCLIKPVCMHRTDAESLAPKTSKGSNDNLNFNPNLSAENARGYALEDFYLVEQTAKLKILVNDFEVLDKVWFYWRIGSTLVARILFDRDLLRNNNHTCNVTDVNKVFKSACCPTCRTFSNRGRIFEDAHLKLKSWLKHLSKTVSDFWEVLSEELRILIVEGKECCREKRQKIVYRVIWKPIIGLVSKNQLQYVHLQYAKNDFLLLTLSHSRSFLPSKTH